jgi:hypothetical protein
MAKSPMSANGPTAGRDGQQEPARAPRQPLGELDDDQLLVALGAVLRTSEPAPKWSTELAEASYDLLAADAELAVLTSDSGLASAQSVLRSAAAPRLTVFDAEGLSVEIQIEPGARVGSWQLIGQLTPAAPARIQIRQPRAESFWVDADDLGRFAVDQVLAGPLSLICARAGLRSAVTAWIAIG